MNGPAQPRQSVYLRPPRVDAFRADGKCHEDMGSDPCGKPAVAMREDPNHGGLYPVCKAHDRP